MAKIILSWAISTRGSAAAICLIVLYIFVVIIGFLAARACYHCRECYLTDTFQDFSKRRIVSDGSVYLAIQWPSINFQVLACAFAIICVIFWLRAFFGTAFCYGAFFHHSFRNRRDFQYWLHLAKFGFSFVGADTRKFIPREEVW